MVLHEAAVLWHETAVSQRCCVTVSDPLLDCAGTAVLRQGSGSPVQQLQAGAVALLHPWSCYGVGVAGSPMLESLNLLLASLDLKG